ncbi:hypothetical protein EDB81DRAFT_892791 [Dactylonectria macrodidyma]|uniref:Uncharacterized protein n=1 Tax=Dactylonectria macrodidyma TaxID=307937 RepID=A0A9P9IDA2_9HYPO|nr:hypothetical protein EDB81DRAFT_892791 [Dactylonectria macrodidyma]
MLFKHFLLNTLLALTSVTTLPNPGTVNYGLKARVDDGDPARLGDGQEFDPKTKQCKYPNG